MTLRILINGEERLRLPYKQADVPSLAQALHRWWPDLSSRGRVFIWSDHEGVSHFIRGQL